MAMMTMPDHLKRRIKPSWTRTFHPNPQLWLPFPPPQPPPRYDFAKPSHSVSDILAVQLAECVRVVRALSDHATAPCARDWERTPAIHAIDNVIGSSAKLAEWIDRIENGTPPAAEARTPRRKASES
jgi:hypothetical protein